MDGQGQRVEHLKKVELRLESAAGDGGPVPFSFVFGVGSEGLSPFEMGIEGRSVGEIVSIPVPDGGPASLFGHLAPPSVNLGSMGGELQVTVTAVAPAEQREIIQAMAEGASCGSDCCGH